MRKIVYALLAVGAAAAVSTSSAEAWGGCGPGGRPTPWGCRPIHHHRYWGGPAYFVAPAWGWGPRWHHRHWHHHYW